MFHRHFYRPLELHLRGQRDPETEVSSGARNQALSSRLRQGHLQGRPPVRAGQDQRHSPSVLRRPTQLRETLRPTIPTQAFGSVFETQPVVPGPQRGVEDLGVEAL